MTRDQDILYVVDNSYSSRHIWCWFQPPCFFHNTHKVLSAHVCQIQHNTRRVPGRRFWPDTAVFHSICNLSLYHDIILGIKG